MRITLLGANHRTMPLAMREKLALSHKHLHQASLQVRDQFPHAEFVFISTCNRTEMYVAHPANLPPDIDQMRSFLADFCEVDLAGLTAATIHRENEQAIGHLFRVVSGLESMVLGEPQILGQVKRAYDEACTFNTVGPSLHKLFQQALTVGKQVRNQTGIDEGRTSVASTAVDFARQIFDRFNDKTIVGVGAGEMAKVTLRHLKGLEPQRIWLVNRSIERAQALLDQLEISRDLGGVRQFDDLPQLLVDADIIISSTAAPHPIITSEFLKPLLKKRRFRPLFLLDIAVPRDVEPQVGALRNVYLYNVDDLQQVVNQTHHERAEHVAQAETMITEKVRSCLSQIQHRDIGHLIKELRSKLHEIGEQEMIRTSNKIHGVEGEQLEKIIEQHTQRVINKILNMPLTELNAKRSEAPLGFYAAALRRLFQLEQNDDTAHDHPLLKFPTSPEAPSARDEEATS
ncbi:MAG: glutamyl-tRNA reductase [Phycisphaeraceae bacterium]|nr:glutamyl-tRNA reductase [Phycisphaeraceae bacterium]